MTPSSSSTLNPSCAETDLGHQHCPDKVGVVHVHHVLSGDGLQGARRHDASVVDEQVEAGPSQAGLGFLGGCLDARFIRGFWKEGNG